MIFIGWEGGDIKYFTSAAFLSLYVVVVWTGFSVVDNVGLDLLVYAGGNKSGGTNGRRNGIVNIFLFCLPDIVYGRKGQKRSYRTTEKYKLIMCVQCETCFISRGRRGGRFSITI